MNLESNNAAWRVASSCGQTSCVQVASLPDAIAVRDGKDPTGPVLAYPRSAWLEFIAQAKLGAFGGSS